MRKFLIVGGLAAAAFIPSLALAQPTTCEQQHANQVAGTVGGAVVGGVIGNQVAGRGNRGAGTAIGAVLGGVIGNQATRPRADCVHAYGWYDRDGRWHANRVDDRSQAYGYWDRDNTWVEGKPNGAYGNDGRWNAASGGGDYGAWDNNGRWVPTSVSGGGYYDDTGGWVAISNRGDDRGSGYANGGGGYGADDWGRGRDTVTREGRIEQRLQRGRDNGSISRGDARYGMAELNYIRRREAGMRTDDGVLAREDEADIQARLDRLSDRLRASRGRN